MRRTNTTLDGTEYLTGIRGLAVLIVLLGHLSNAGIPLLPGMDLTATAKAGVWLFFVLSAYLLTDNLMRDIGINGLSRALGRYSVKRIFRIIPTYLAFLAGSVSLSMIDAPTAIQHAVLTRGDGHLWTIPVEMSFYVVLPVIVVGLLRFPPARRPWAASAIAAFSVLIYYTIGPAGIVSNSINLLHYLPFFAVGVLLSMASRADGSPSVGWMGLVALFILTPRAISTLTGATVEQALEWSWLFALAWGCVMLGSRSGMLRLFFSARLLILLGKISFSLYLVHYAIVQKVGQTAIFGSFGGAVAVVASLAVAATLYWLIEKRSQMLGHYLASRLAEPARPLHRRIAIEPHP